MNKKNLFYIFNLLTSLFFLFTSLSLSFATEGSHEEFGIDDLRTLDCSIDQTLIKQGYTCDPSNLVLIVDNHKEATVSERVPSKCSTDHRVMIKASLVVSSLYWLKRGYGGELSIYVRPFKNHGFTVHADLDWIHSYDTEHQSISLDANIARTDFYAGLTAQRLMMKNTYIEAEPIFELDAYGVEAGYSHVFNLKLFGTHIPLNIAGRITAVTAETASFGESYQTRYYWPEGRLYLGFLLFKK